MRDMVIQKTLPYPSKLKDNMMDCIDTEYLALEAEYQEKILPEYYADEEDGFQEMLWEDWVAYQETLLSLRYQ